MKKKHLLKRIVYLEDTVLELKDKIAFIEEHLSYMPQVTKTVEWGERKTTAAPLPRPLWETTCGLSRYGD